LKVLHEALGLGVVVVIAAPAHGTDETMFGEYVTMGLGSAVTPSIFSATRRQDDRLDHHRALDRHENARTDQDLTGLSFVAKTRGDVGYRPDRGVVEAPLEADGLHPDWVAGISIGAIKTCRSDVR